MIPEAFTKPKTSRTNALPPFYLNITRKKKAQNPWTVKKKKQKKILKASSFGHKMASRMVARRGAAGAHRLQRGLPTLVCLETGRGVGGSVNREPGSYLYIYIYIYICVCMYMCMCMYMYMYTHTLPRKCRSRYMNP